jgi:hypothetical protein
MTAVSRPRSLPAELNLIAPVSFISTPLVQFLNFDQQDEATGVTYIGTGAGVGAYARAGIEFKVTPYYFVGLGARYTKCDIELDNDLGTFDVEGVQACLTVTTAL